MNHTAALLEQVVAAGQDFEWYPTTERMIAAVSRWLPVTFESLMDIGAGDGRVLAALAKKSEKEPALYAIEKSMILIQNQPESITPVGVDFYEQNLACLPVDYIFSNPPYSDFETWAVRIIETGFALKAFLVLPKRWSESKLIAEALTKRGAKTRVIHQDTFENADRRARAVIDIVEVTFPTEGRSWKGNDAVDPFDVWFDQNIFTFEAEQPLAKDVESAELARLRNFKTILELVEGFNEEHARMEENYRKIFTLDYALLKELGVNKTTVRDGIKARMSGLKAKYWGLLFERLDTITSRLSTATKKKFLERLTGRTAVAFTYDNAYAVVMWAIKHANKYYDQQLVTLFKDLATFEGVQKYKSNTKTWEASGWRYNAKDDKYSHYALDYRIVIQQYKAMFKAKEDLYSFGRYEFPGDLHTKCHELIDDVIAVFSNLGYAVDTNQAASRMRQWSGGQWQDFTLTDGRVLFQVKGYLNGNLHFRIMPEAMRRFNIEAGRLMGWVSNPQDVVDEMGYSAEEAASFFGTNRQLNMSNVKLLTA